MDRYGWFRIVRSVAQCDRPVAYWFARRFALLSDVLDRAKREAVRDNLRVILGPKAPEREIRRLSALTSRHFGLYFAEFFGAGKLGPEFIARRVRTLNYERVEQAVAGGKGAVFLTGHFSNWEMGAAILAHKGIPVIGVAQVHPDPRLHSLFQRMRALRGYTTIPPEGAFRRCCGAIRQGTCVCFVADRDVGAGSVEVDFFGRPVLFPQAPARLALVTGAQVVPGFVVRRPDGRLDGVVEEIIRPPPRGDRKQKARAMTQQFASLVERYVRAYPEQWGVFHRVWED